MAQVAHATYLFDPLCGWCYGAAPVLARLAADADLAIAYLPTGLFAGQGARAMDKAFAAFAWRNDERIAEMTGQPFSAAYRDQVLGTPGRFDSGPATLALTAVALTAADREAEALQAIQAARFVQGRDVTDLAVLAETLRELGLVEAADRLARPDDALHAACQARIAQGQAAMRRFGANGVPAMLAGSGEARRLVPANALLGDAAALIASLKTA
ncbi:DsbA family protein [Sphingomonas pituitosa]|uniref:DsbA family protein n=1 Tax=Sphingomonas pituitosa TaxID=99597 RepID=UPI00082ABC51|nr:DsbA family protein [Sphingomonas pituitosa]